MDFLDIRTIVFNYVLIDIVCLILVILLWTQNRHRFAGTAFFVFDYVCQTVALFLIIFRGSIPDWASIVLAITLVIVGTLLGYMGLLRFVGQKSNQVANYIIVAFLCLTHFYFTYIQPDLAARSFNLSAGLFIMTVQCAWLLLYRVPTRLRSLTRNVGIVFAIYSLVSAVRMIEFFTGTHYRTDFFAPAAFDAAIVFIYQMLFVLLTFTLALMFNKRLLADITGQEDKFSKAFHSSPYAVIISRMSDGTFLEVNEGFVQLSGYGYDEIKNKTSLDLRLWQNNSDRAAIVRNLQEQGKVLAREILFRNKNGNILTGLFSAELITLDGEACLLSSIEDISQRKVLEEELYETRDYLENLFNYANAPIIVWDSKYHITKFNRAFERLSGRNETDVLGQSVALLFPDESRDQSLEYIEQASAGNRWETVEIDIQHLFGDVRRLLWNSASLYQRDGKTILATIAQGQDITERKRAEEEIRRLNDELERKVIAQTQELQETQMALLNLVDDLNASARKITLANQSLEAVNKELAAFSYSVSHDLRAPLRSIDGFGNALLEDYGNKLDEEGQHYLQRIRKATQTMGQLIDDLLNLSRVTQSDFYRQEFDLSEMIRSLAEANQQKLPLDHLTLDIQDGVVAHADQRLINIAMTNLLDNAWKFSAKTEEPKISFGITHHNGEAEFFIRDNGAGFDMAYAGKLFGAFQRLHRADEFPGTGIGLATVQRIITRHGGRIRAQSEINKGAAFYFTLGEPT